MKFSLVALLLVAASVSAQKKRTYGPGYDHYGCPVTTETITQSLTRHHHPFHTEYVASTTVSDCTTDVVATATVVVYEGSTETTVTETGTVDGSTITSYGPATTTTSTVTDYHTTCSGGRNDRRFKTYTPRAERAAIATATATPDGRMTNAERLRRRLPVSKPVIKRHDHKPAHSCQPNTETRTVHSTVATVTVTPTETQTVETASDCTATRTGHFRKITTTEYERTRTRTMTATEEGDAVTETVTPTRTVEWTSIQTLYTGKCGRH